ncbi:MAG: hypothetical protein ABEH80_08585 [Halobaculum sp.]|jgi:hypothetical protein
MTHPTDSSWDGPSAPETGAADDADAVESIEMYEDDGRVVLFDGENPLAWLEASRTVTLSDLA